MTNGVEYTDVDLNATGATTIHDPDHNASVYGVTMANPGSTAEFALEVTNGTDTAVIERPGAGSKLLVGNTLAVDGEQQLQINVTTAEGSATTATAAVFIGD